MKTTLTIVMASVLSNLAVAQIGINTADPMTTLDVNAKNRDGSTAEGILPPRLTGDQMKAGDAQYSIKHAGTVVYVTSPVISGTAKTANVTAAGMYYFDGVVWQKVMQGDRRGLAVQTTGDIKNSVKAIDHGGWYLLNGRNVSSLPQEAKAYAASLGYTEKLPNATDRVLKTRSGTELLGSEGGDNSMILTRSNLPNINLVGFIQGEAESAGAHAHGAGQGGFLLGGTTVGNSGGGNYQGNDTPDSWDGVGILGNTATSGAHTHKLAGTTTIPLGGEGATLDNRSAYLVVNTFIYLGG